LIVYDFSEELGQVVMGPFKSLGRMVGRKLFDFAWAAFWLSLFVLLDVGFPILVAFLGVALFLLLGIPCVLIEAFEDLTGIEVVDSTWRMLVASGGIWFAFFTFGGILGLGLWKLLELAANFWQTDPVLSWIALGGAIATMTVVVFLLAGGSLLVARRLFAEGEGFDRWGPSPNGSSARGGIRLGEVFFDEWEYL